MVARAETPQLHLLPIPDLLGIAVAPFYWDVRISVGVDQNVECAVPVQLRQEGDGGGDLAEYGLDLRLDLLFRFLRQWLVIFPGFY